MSDFFPIEEVMPHERPLLLLERVLDVGADFIECEVVVRSDGLFDTNAQVPGLLGLEYMAQTVAACSGYKARSAGRPVQLGFLLGTRRFKTNVSSFACGTRLAVRATCVMSSAEGMASFDCELFQIASDELIEQSARISVFEPEDSDSYLERSIMRANKSTKISTGANTGAGSDTSTGTRTHV